MGIVLALFFFLLYYSIFSLGLSIGEGGGMPPVIGLWSGNILFAFAGVIGLRMTAKERTPSLASLLRHALFRRKKALPGGNSR